MKTIAVVLSLVVCMVLAPGCSEKPRGRFNFVPRRVTIVTEPAGATVTQLRPLGQPSVKLGLTPLYDQVVMVMTDIQMEHMPFNEAQELLRHANNLVVRIEKDGYETYLGAHSTVPDETNVYEIELQPKP